MQRSGVKVGTERCTTKSLCRTSDPIALYVNRSLPDAELDEFVDTLARRIASFDKQAIAETKRLVNLASLPPDSEIAPEWGAFIDSLGRNAARDRIRQLMDRGFHHPGDVETRLGHYVGELAS